MSYTPTTWATGDVITAEKLNHIEAGIEGAQGKICFFSFQADTETDEIETDAEFDDIKAAIEDGFLVVGWLWADGIRRPCLFTERFDGSLFTECVHIGGLSGNSIKVESFDITAYTTDKVWQFTHIEKTVA